MNNNDPTPARPHWLERCTYAAYLGSGLLALALALLALGSGRHVLLLHAALSLAAALLFRARLVIVGQLAACAEEDDAPGARYIADGETTSSAGRDRGDAALECRRDLAHADP